MNPPNSTQKLSSRTAVITGGTSGIGLATANLFASEGAEVVAIGSQESRFGDVRHQLHTGVSLIAADVRSLSALRAVAETVKQKVGGLDILFVNAGIVYSTPLSSTDEEQYDGLMNVNLKGAFFTMQVFAPLLREGGSVILTTSFVNQAGLPGLSLVAASKAAMRSFARSWSRELLERKIRVNAVSPGYINTPLHTKVGGSATEVEARKDRFAAQIPVGRLGTSEEVAQAVLFLASDESKYIVGAELVVDGGISQL